MILARMARMGLTESDVARRADVPVSVVNDFLGALNRDVGVSQAERIWRAVGLDVVKR